MLGTYPIIIKGENCGRLNVTKEGAYTRFVADCSIFGGVIRLSVYGGGKEGYLGVPMPANGRFRLDKRLSPAALRSFPEKIERCSLAGEPAEEKCAEAEEKTETPACHKEEQRDTLWYATTDGALVSKAGEQEMVALPHGDERIPSDIPGSPRIIDGKEYLVYITKSH